MKGEREGGRESGRYMCSLLKLAEAGVIPCSTWLYTTSERGQLVFVMLLHRVHVHRHVCIHMTLYMCMLKTVYLCTGQGCSVREDDWQNEDAVLARCH